MLRIIREARNRGCFLELNAHPERLDLLDTQCQMAKEEGVLISINSDAHSVYDFANLRFGIGQARLAGKKRCAEYPFLEGIAPSDQSHHVIIMLRSTP